MPSLNSPFDFAKLMANEPAAHLTELSGPPASLASVKALVFDILGTTVDWAGNAINALKTHVPPGEAAQSFDVTEVRTLTATHSSGLH